MSSKMLNVAVGLAVGTLAIAGAYNLFGKYAQTTTNNTDDNDDNLEEKLGKMSYYDIPESPFDDLPIIEISKEFLERVRVSMNKLDEPLESSKFFSSLKTHGFAVVELPSRATIQDAEEKMKEFFKVAASNVKRYHSGSKTPNGYKKLYFPNRESKRDPEERDVFQVYKGHSQYNDWYSSELKEKCEKAYDFCYDTTSKLLSIIAMNLKVDLKDITSLIKPSENGVGSEDSNLVFFHYEDKRGYFTTQKCMVHQDESFITMLPKSTFPGLQIFDPSTQSWLEIESSLKENEIVVYCGRALSLITNDLIPATTHRVVREPHKERYSCPFQLKPHTMAKLEYLKSPIVPLYPPIGKSRFGYSNDEILLPKTVTEVKNIITWERIQNKLARIAQKEKTTSIENRQASEDEMESVEHE